MSKCGPEPKQRFYPLIPGFAEWRERLFDSLLAGHTSNEALANLIKECPVPVLVTSFDTSPQWVEVPGKDAWSAEREYQDPGITLTLSINDQ